MDSARWAGAEASATWVPGAQGMLAMKNAGAWTIGQDQDSCVVYGMPREAANVGALHEVATLNDIAARIVAKLGN